MVDAVVSHLITDPNGIYLDGTLGFGGHAEAILNKLMPSGQYIGLDADPYALEFSKKRLSVHQALLTLHHVNYREFPEVLASMGVPQVTGLFFDIGFSSYQIDSRERGFSFQYDAPLDMRFNPNQSLTAKELLNSFSEKDIGIIIKELGEEKNWRKISRSIVEASKNGNMETTFHLKDAISAVTNPRFVNKTLARVFQGIRIYINDELESLKIALKSSLKYLAVGGRIGVISFHSLEDRIVKKFFQVHSVTCVCPKAFPMCICDTKPELKIVNRKAIVPTAEEIEANSRARSAKLRFAERI
jgi:16S rRNA (cytosine1402-N4)-methyltransferase